MSLPANEPLGIKKFERKYAELELNAEGYVKDGGLSKSSQGLLRCNIIQIFESMLEADRSTAPSILWGELIEAVKQRFPEHLHKDIARLKPPRFRTEVSVGRDRNQSMEEFRYSPLQNETANPRIRLLILLPAKEWSSDIAGVLCQDMLETCSYEALSYVWGDPQDTVRISINKKSCAITRNLEEALRALRLRDRPRVLWVDAICINQKDNSEKSKQIQLMGKIYGRARRVLIWLGPGSNSVEKALRFFIQFKWTLRELDIHKPVCDKTDLCFNGQCRDEGMSSRSPLLWVLLNMGVAGAVYENGCKLEGLMRCIVKLLQRPWWSRIWVLQEVSLSSNALLCCGSLSMAWDQFARCSNLLVGFCGSRRIPVDKSKWQMQLDERQWITSHLPLIEELEHLLQPLATMAAFRTSCLDDSRLTLVRLISMTQRFQSTDPRDKIYALLSLASEQLDYGEIGVPNYEMSTETLYAKVAQYFLSEHKGPFLGLFEKLPEPHHAPGFVKQKLSLPSWVPDFREGSDAVPIDGAKSGLWDESDDILRSLPFSVILLEQNCFGFKYGRNPRSKAQPIAFQISEDLKFLTVHGATVERISALSDPCGKDIKASVQSWKRKFIDVEPEDRAYVRGGTVRTAYWYSMLANQADSWHLQYPISSGKNESPGRTRGRGVSPGEGKERYNIEEVLSHHPPVCYTRRLFQTPKGLIGLGPGTMKCGDIVTILLGVRLPVILREKGEAYEVIGASYVHYLDASDILGEDAEGRQELEEFVLC